MVIIPLSILSIMESTDAKVFLILSTVGHYSLFPLLFPSSLLLVKVLLLILYSLYAFHSLYKMYPLSICSYTLPLLNPLESMYVWIRYYHFTIIAYFSLLRRRCYLFLGQLLYLFFCDITVFMSVLRSIKLIKYDLVFIIFDM
ncbi:hypothetical protein NQ317_002037, partial [Molorchus minor]